jgi:hypothetical protein
MSTIERGSVWRTWDFQVQTILDDRYEELSVYSEELKKEFPSEWAKLTGKVGGEENAIKFDSKSYVFDSQLPVEERYNNYARILFSFLEVFRPNLGLIGFTDHNYSGGKLIDFIFEYSKKNPCKSVCGVEINASGVHMLVYFEKPPFQKSNFSDGINSFLDSIGITAAKKDGVLAVSAKSVLDVVKNIEDQNGIYLFPHCNSDNGLFQERGRTDRTHLADMYNHKLVTFMQCKSKAGANKVCEYIKGKPDLFKSSPLFSISSDSRALKDIGVSDDKGNYTWVKADCGFQGMRQILIERDRVFIGDEPVLLERIRNNPTKFIDSLAINKVAGAQVDDIWFSNFAVPLNYSLVAIIGNKGAGKSAITDILSLCGNTHQDPSNFSFLTQTKFRKVKPVNLSEKFEAQIVWMDGVSVKKRLNENPDKKSPERVRYIPQNFLEKLCTSVESEDFEREIKQIIFAHTPSEKRLGKSSLDELINYKSGLVTSDLEIIKAKISKINLSIIEAEDKSSDNYRIQIVNAISLKKGELEALDRNKPLQPPVDPNSIDSGVNDKIADLRKRITDSEGEIVRIRGMLATAAIDQEEIKQILQYLSNLKLQLEKVLEPANDWTRLIAKRGLKIEEIFRFSVNMSPIEGLKTSIDANIALFNEVLNENNTQGIVFIRNDLATQLKSLQELLDRPAREQQKYLDDLKEWERKMKFILGSVNDEGSLSYWTDHLDYIDKRLPVELEGLYALRNSYIGELFDKKQELIVVRSELFSPVSDFINDFKELKERYDVRINVTLEHNSFLDSFFTYINQLRVGSFSGKEEGYKRMSDLLDKSHFDSKEGFIQFSNDLMEALKFDLRNINKPLVETRTLLKGAFQLYQLYDFIFHFDYIQPIYNLNLGNKSLIELSPGERGALLLIFYLILDMDDIPLLIDQPEENLDNESVYHILVHFIKQVKEKRQLIIVTHNPNLAIVCDAEQIIHMNIEKENKNKVTFYTGSIENLRINNTAVDILEGTMPAFNNRDSKYIKERWVEG